MTTFVNIFAALCFGGGSLLLLLVGACEEDARQKGMFVSGWIFGALAMLGLMRFL